MKTFINYLGILCLFGITHALHAQDPQLLRETSQDFIGVAKIATGSVVSIQVKSKAKASASNPFDYDPSWENFQDDFFGQFFGIPKKDKELKQFQEILGSGFIVSANGHILTNDHVVKDHVTIRVKLNDGREFEGVVIGEDESTDLALIKIEAKDLPYLPLGDSDHLQVGQWVVAIGNPFGLEASLTAGIVSAKGRSNLDIARIEDFIQTDAAINMGNSGGPLLNLKSEVVGINTAIASTLGGFSGIGFAVPSNLAKHVMDQLMITGSVTRGFIGIVMQEINADLAQAFDLKKAEGALIAEVLRDSPADKAGLKQGDIIIKINQQKVVNFSTLRNAIALQKPGSNILLTIIRKGNTQDINVETGTFKNPDEKIEIPDQSLTNNHLGINVLEISPEIAQKYSLKDTAGVVISSVEDTSPAKFVGLKKGMIVLAVNNEKVNSKKEFDQLVNETPKGKPVLLLIKQSDAMRYVSIRSDN